MFDSFLWKSNGDVVVLLKNGISKSHIASNCNKNSDSVYEREKFRKGKITQNADIKKRLFYDFYSIRNKWDPLSWLQHKPTHLITKPHAQINRQNEFINQIISLDFNDWRVLPFIRSFCLLFFFAIGSTIIALKQSTWRSFYESFGFISSITLTFARDFMFEFYFYLIQFNWIAGDITTHDARTTEFRRIVALHSHAALFPPFFLFTIKKIIINFCFDL